ncbi:Glucose dehydrogenase [FAD, quinone] [Orchesella cincta]|uniref:Glucose dehydrogenase [FAD, quinone] n=1 Tax=Orchesella cincta TaxID=48709 RepID=A0A1D2MLL9_ORCCI|nr:Glucose dehydrogenase [FAD, quinone] [Orchesella cincta]
MANLDFCRYFALFFIGVLPYSNATKIDSYDFIVVGGGTAGCVAAGRLSENGKFNVLLLEAGGVPIDDMDIPAFAPTFQVDPEWTFQYKSVPQTNASLAYNGIVNIPLGRVLGGTSSLNYMFFNRGSPKDFDNWARIADDPSWNYSNMLQHFKKSEDYAGEFPPTDQHGIGGPILITNQSYAPGLETWLEAGIALNYSVADPNGPQKISFTPIEYNKRAGRRISSYTAFIKPFENSRSNLKVVTRAYATELVMEGNKAVGVKYNNSNNEIISVYATKEVIVSAGAYGSPMLLMKSGIGPKEVLESSGIPLIKELPVGNNLQDHPIVPIQLIINNKSLLFDPVRDLTPENLELYQREGVGPYTTTAGLFAQAYVASTVATAEGEEDWADIQFSMYAQTFLTGLPDVNLGSWEAPIFAYPYLGRQKSRGTVKLDPTNINNQPLIDFNFLSDPRDFQITIDSIQMTMKIMEETVPYRFLGARYPPVPLTVCQHLHFRSEEYWECYVKQMLVGGNHPVGTCKMGVSTDPEAVVDSKLRVIGIDGLRVVDASIMPVITNANVQAAIFAIGEKGADEILKEWDR